MHIKIWKRLLCCCMASIACLSSIATAIYADEIQMPENSNPETITSDVYSLDDEPEYDVQSGISELIPVDGPDDGTYEEGIDDLPDAANVAFPSGIGTQSDGTYYWGNATKKKIGRRYGKWQFLSSGSCPCTIKTSKKRVVKTKLSETVTISESALESLMGFEMGYKLIDETTLTEYIKTPDFKKGKVYELDFRRSWIKYKITQKRYYRIDGVSHETGETRHFYVYKPSSIQTKVLPYGTAE